MSIFARLFGPRRPEYAFYADRSSKGNYSCRLVEAADMHNIQRGKPQTVLMLPIRSRFSEPPQAVLAAHANLASLGLSAGSHLAVCYCEDADGRVRSIPNPMA